MASRSKLEKDNDALNNAQVPAGGGGLKQEGVSFSSAFMEAEIKLAKARVFTHRLKKPNALQTAVAMDVLWSLRLIFGRFQPII